MDTCTDIKARTAANGDTLPAPWVLWPACICTAVLFVVCLCRWNEVLFIEIHSLAGRPGGIWWTHVTILGDGLVAAVLLLPFVKRRPDILFALVVASLVAAVLTQGIKPWLNTPRPPRLLAASALLNVLGPSHTSRAFPSGHATTAFMIAGVVAMSVPKAWRPLCIAVAAAVALSRVVVGVHWPTDVLAGAVYGWIAAAAGVAAAQRWKWGWSRPAALVWGGILIAGGVVMILVNHTGYHSTFRFQQLIAVESLSWGITEYLALLRRNT